MGWSEILSALPLQDIEPQFGMGQGEGFVTADEAIEDFSVYTDADCFSIHYKIVMDEVVTKIHAMDKKIHVWIVNETEDIKHCVKMGVDNIITNDVEYVRGKRSHKIICLNYPLLYSKMRGYNLFKGEI